MDQRICSKYVWEDINLFLQSYSVSNTKIHCTTDVINHIIFAFTILIIIGLIGSYLLCTINVLILFMIIAFIHMLYWITNYNNTPPLKETFEVNVPVDKTTVLENVIGQKVTFPNSKNPFMNVLVDEIKYNPKRPQAISIMDPLVTIGLDDFFRTQFVNDPTDVFGKTQSQRQFYTNPSTTVPNDQGSYQDWLYKIPGKTCKEGGREACSASTGSSGGLIPWLSDN
jgi:hypothetical protein